MLALSGQVNCNNFWSTDEKSLISSSFEKAKQYEKAIQEMFTQLVNMPYYQEKFPERFEKCKTRYQWQQPVSTTQSLFDNNNKCTIKERFKAINPSLSNLKAYYSHRKFLTDYVTFLETPQAPTENFDSLQSVKKKLKLLDVNQYKHLCRETLCFSLFYNSFETYLIDPKIEEVKDEYFVLENQFSKAVKIDARYSIAKKIIESEYTFSHSIKLESFCIIALKSSDLTQFLKRTSIEVANEIISFDKAIENHNVIVNNYNRNRAREDEELRNQISCTIS